MTTRFEPCDTSLIHEPIGEVATEEYNGEVIVYVYGEGFRVRIDGEKLQTLLDVCQAVDLHYFDGRRQIGHWMPKGSH